MKNMQSMTNMQKNVEYPQICIKYVISMHKICKKNAANMQNKYILNMQNMQKIERKFRKIVNVCTKYFKLCKTFTKYAKCAQTMQGNLTDMQKIINKKCKIYAKLYA